MTVIGGVKVDADVEDTARLQRLGDVFQGRLRIGQMLEHDQLMTMSKLLLPGNIAHMSPWMNPG
jgi:hypothetical protein